jgi:pyruvate,orthophosphate dikinase
MRETDVTLETHFPEIYRELKRWAHVLIDDHGWSPQEIEFTFEGPPLTIFTCSKLGTWPFAKARRF